MFNLDLIEQDWKNNSFYLNEEEIIEIYRSEGATLSKYEEELDEYKKKINSSSLSFEEIYLRHIFGEDLSLQEQKTIEKVTMPKKKHLSEENQKKVVEGCLYMVFDETHGWYNFFEGKISMERIYYICLEALMNSVKYLVHNEKPTFGFYVSKSIEKNIINYISRYMNITYNEAYEMILYIHGCDPQFSKKFDEYLKSILDFEIKEVLQKPSQIYEQLKNECYDENYIKNISSNEFITDFKIALENLDDVAKIVMQLSFDNNGYRGLTNAEIADYLGVNVRKISTIRKEAVKILRKNSKLKMYL